MKKKLMLSSIVVAAIVSGFYLIYQKHSTSDLQTESVNLDKSVENLVEKLNTFFDSKSICKEYNLLFQEKDFDQKYNSHFNKLAQNFVDLNILSKEFTDNVLMDAGKIEPNEANLGIGREYFKQIEEAFCLVGQDSFGVANISPSVNKDYYNIFLNKIISDAGADHADEKEIGLEVYVDPQSKQIQLSGVLEQ